MAQRVANDNSRYGNKVGSADFVPITRSNLAFQTGSDAAMTSPAWQLEGSLARLETAALGATFDAARPSQGLTSISAAGWQLADLRLLAMELPPSVAAEELALTECYARGNDLVTAYQERRAWPVEIDATWRAVRSAGQDGVLGAVELVISVRTSLLESRPQLAITTTSPGTPALRLVDPATARYEPVSPAPGRAQAMEPQTGPGCVVLRLPGVPLSYVEMVHPADFRGDRLAADGPEQLELRHHLFQESLEKGVLLRARIRGVLVARDGDLPAAAACYAAFAAAEPPLGS